MTPRRFHFVANDLAGSPLGRVLRSASIENNQGTSANTGMRHFDHYALVYLLSGRGEYRDANAVIRTIGAGDLLVLFPGLPHAYFPPRGEAWNEFNIVFDGAVFDLWRQQGLLDPSAPVLHLEPIEHWAQRMQQAVEPEDSREEDPSARICRIQLLLSDILRFQKERKVGVAGRLWLTRARAELDRVAGAVNEELALDWDEISGRFGITYAGFRKRFTALAGVPPSKYVAKRVIDRAAELLGQGQMSVREVADACGFCDEFHFARRFKQILGITPAQFRGAQFASDA